MNPKCPNCKDLSTGFELVESKVKNCDLPMHFVICSVCGSIVHGMFYNKFTSVVTRICIKLGIKPTEVL